LNEVLSQYFSVENLDPGTGTVTTVFVLALTALELALDLFRFLDIEYHARTHTHVQYMIDPLPHSKPVVNEMAFTVDPV
jgi:hypothetical protein